MKQYIFEVTITAPTEKECSNAYEDLIQHACDISNSGNAQVIVMEADIEDVE